ncbi:MAG: Mfa1 family fimbria major subunit [Tannerellaceae bacterium]|nr:Mfa1 family fimbria major subunit [Tannerellaceae bacterium]
MNFRRYLYFAVATLALVACNNSDDITDDPETGLHTYVNLSIYFPNATSTKALPEDYNDDGEYEGHDAVETLDLYLVNSDNTLSSSHRFSGTEISTNGSVVSLAQPFRTTAGNKTIYVVLNDPNPTGSFVLSETTLVPIANLARTVTVNGEVRDLITMTGKTPNTVAIEPDISQQAAVGGANHFSIEVERVASRVIVTLDDAISTTLTTEEGTTIGTLSNILYSVAQGTTEVYVIRNADYETYGYDFIPATDADHISQAPTYYDYSDLSTPTAIPTLPAAGDGYKSLQGKFLFENTHPYGATVNTSGYKKGNTAYVLVKATLTPVAAAIADGGALTGGTFYVGQSDGLIYSSKQAAQAAVQNQKVATYQGGKMLYYAWLNPDNIDAPLNSPVARNNIYHINITGFGKIGYNWNPLYPEDPDTGTPQNPDPKPVNPDEPDPPVDPTDPLTPEQTYMTVEVTALNWTVHSYDIEL